jgi:hypothetical protein
MEAASLRDLTHHESSLSMLAGMPGKISTRY